MHKYCLRWSEPRSFKRTEIITIFVSHGLKQMRRNQPLPARRIDPRWVKVGSSVPEAVAAADSTKISYFSQRRRESASKTKVPSGVPNAAPTMASRVQTPELPSSKFNIQGRNMQGRLPSAKVEEKQELSGDGRARTASGDREDLKQRPVVNSGSANGAGNNRSQTPSEVFFSNQSEKTDIAAAYCDDRSSGSDRLNLDRRGLTTIPLLEGESDLRLLNLENNLLRNITNLHCLPNLIFLDIYNNQLQQISGLEGAPHLRVLMLGKNQIKKIEKLELVPKLDVLDLHCNLISRIEGLSNLKDLRVLNLAGNNITEVDRMDGLSSLTELNLRRNQVATVQNVSGLTSLSRFFLSKNQINSFDSIQTIFSIKTLAELSLDGNPVASNRYYRQYLLEQIKQLRHLDLKKISEEERRMSAREMSSLSIEPAHAGFHTRSQAVPASMLGNNLTGAPKTDRPSAAGNREISTQADTVPQTNNLNGMNFVTRPTTAPMSSSSAAVRLPLTIRKLSATAM
jgi:hypothetical protein